MILLTYFTKQWLYLRHHVHDVQLQAGIFGTMSMVCSCKQEWRTRYSGTGWLHRNPRWVQPPNGAFSSLFRMMEPHNIGTGRPVHSKVKLFMWLVLLRWLWTADCQLRRGRLKRIWPSVTHKLLLLKASLLRNPVTCLGMATGTRNPKPDGFLLY